MKRNFLLAVLAIAAVAMTTADASAWGWWRYRMACHGPLFPRLAAHHACRPYNAFTPSPCCNSCNMGRGGFGHRAGPWHGGGCNTCMASPVMQDQQNAQYTDPSLLPYMAQAAPVQMQMPMPIQQTGYYPYGVQPVNYMPNYYPGYQPYPYYYYPQPVAPYNAYGYGYGYGY